MSRWRIAVSRSSRHSRLTTRRPSQTHSGLPAGPTSRWAASAISSMLFWPSLAVLSAGFCFSGGATLPLWATAAVALKLNAATQNAARNTRNKDTNDIVPPVIMEVARPLSGLLSDRIGTRLRHFLPAAPALLVTKTRTLEPNRRLGANFPIEGLAVQDLAPTGRLCPAPPGRLLKRRGDLGSGKCAL